MGQINLTLAAHYCNDELKNTEVTIVPHAHNCCDASGAETNVPDCCKDHFSTSESDEYFGKTSFQVDLSPEFVLAYVLSFELFFDEEAINTQGIYQFPNRSIPDLHILHQSFII